MSLRNALRSAGLAAAVLVGLNTGAQAQTCEGIVTNLRDPEQLAGLAGAELAQGLLRSTTLCASDEVEDARVVVIRVAERRAADIFISDPVRMEPTDRVSFGAFLRHRPGRTRWTGFPGASFFSGDSFFPGESASQGDSFFPDDMFLPEICDFADPDCKIETAAAILNRRDCPVLAAAEESVERTGASDGVFVVVLDTASEVPSSGYAVPLVSQR